MVEKAEPEIASRPVVLQRLESDGLVCILDEPVGAEPIGDVVLAPAFGVTADAMFPFAYNLARNGFRVHRVEFSDHVGQSPGDIENATLSRQALDIEDVVAATTQPILVALSLSCRPALRVLSRSSSIRGAVLVTPVVDVRSTLDAVVGEDYLSVPRCEMPDSLDVLAYTVNRSFGLDALDEGFSDLDGSLEEAAGAKCPVHFIAGDADDWVDIGSVEKVAQMARTAGVDARLTRIPAAMHRINRNPAIAVRYIEASVRACRELAGLDPASAHISTFNEMLRSRARSRRQERRARTAVEV